MMPRATFALYCTMCAGGIVESVYVVWYLDEWIVAGQAAVAVILILLPVFIWREFRMVREYDRDFLAYKHAQMLAGNEYLRRAREADLLALDQERQQLAAAVRKLPPRDHRGRFVKARQWQIEGSI
jgi:hypothetical protein